MSLWKRLLSLARFKRDSRSRYFKLDESLAAALERLASQDPTPSPDDVAVTRAMVQAGKLLDIQLLDHLSIGGSRFVSLKERELGFN